MENPTILSASSSGRRSSSASNSPEFEFWMIRNPSCPETTLHSVDELFSGGVLLPLQLLNTHIPDEPPDEPPDVTATSPTLTASKRWKDIFKKRPQSKEKEEKKKKDRNGGSSGGGTSAAELNINLWPFSRSRSAGNGGSRPRTSLSGSRKVSSAPCSRSNSAGESKSRKWPSSPSRNGVHLGRSGSVWQVKRVGSGRNSNDNMFRRVSAIAIIWVVEVTWLTTAAPYVPVGGNSGGAATQSDGVGTGGDVARGSNLFNLRSLFKKKVY